MNTKTTSERGTSFMDDLLNKYETAKRVNHLIAEETKKY